MQAHSIQLPRCPQDAWNFNARFPGCSVNGMWVLEVCIHFLWESVPNFGHDTRRENLPMSLPETPPYPQHKFSVWEMSIGSEYIIILLTLCCLLLNCSVFFFSLLADNKTSTLSKCIQYTIYITGLFEKMIWIDLKKILFILVLSFHYMYYDVCKILGIF